MRVGVVEDAFPDARTVRPYRLRALFPFGQQYVDRLRNRKEEAVVRALRQAQGPNCR